MQTCGKQFRSRPSLNGHIESLFHNKRCPTRGKPYICFPYGRRFGSRYALGKHVSSHFNKDKSCVVGQSTIESKFLYSSRTTNSLTNYSRSSFYCEMCGQSFTFHHDLAKHLKVHNSKAFPCERCGLEFESSYDLVDHLMTQTSEPSFSLTCVGKRYMF